ncbi:prepilin-type N-terminal cleavage/methylation domain-containing protein, partial [Acinetobacter baumannii]
MTWLWRCYDSVNPRAPGEQYLRDGPGCLVVRRQSLSGAPSQPSPWDYSMKKAFTLIELLVVIAIIAILAAIL